MIVSIMQPYFFPYIGYFQLIAASDVFVFHDDVQYIKNGWINRNRILSAGVPRWLTRPVLSASYELKINQRRYELSARNVPRLLRQVEAAYSKTQRFVEIFPLCREILGFADANVAVFNANLIRRVAAALHIDTQFLFSSEIEKDDRLTGQDRVIEICRELGATRYVNPIGGAHLYDARRFADAGLQLSFLQPVTLTSGRFVAAQAPPLSIVDTLMFNDDRAMQQLLRSFRLADATDLAYAAG
ncbi:MAG: WbqC family protein [Alphaproteobacteria bacterium]|nr:WbqC family protein [Alphaproteobacteria bacterium]